MNQVLIDHYRCPEDSVRFTLANELSGDPGYFCFGRNTICYGQCSSTRLARRITDPLHDVLADVKMNGTNHIPFDVSQVIDNLRREKYLEKRYNIPCAKGLLNAYYFVRPLIGTSFRRRIQRLYYGRRGSGFPAWPVDVTVERILERLLCLALSSAPGGKIPFIWFWPNGAPSCAIITHDVEELGGVNFCTQLMDLDDKFAIKASFEIVPEQRYSVTGGFLDGLRKRGFEINVHDINHDGYLFRSHGEFLRRAERINQYGKGYGAAGFRSGTMYRNVEWYDELDFSYDMSLPNVAHLDPQWGGCCTVMPFFVGKILELPTTTIQDYTLFHILEDYSIDLWKRQVSAIMNVHGLANFIIHPDYVSERRAQATYMNLLSYLSDLRSGGKLWIAPPGEVSNWWRQRSQMKLVQQGNAWHIEGPGKERARIAYAHLTGGRVAYEVEAGFQRSGALGSASSLGLS